MADFTRVLQRFFFKGMQLVPQDALSDGKAAYALNIRGYQPGTFAPRSGLSAQLSNGPFSDPVHSLFRLNDTTPFADPSAPQRRFIGEGPRIDSTEPGNTASVGVDTGYSGNPLTGVVAPPVNSARPYLYVGDSQRIRKIDGFLNDYSIGLGPPAGPPTATLGHVNSTFLEDITNTGWAPYGVNASVPTQQPRIVATATQVVFDSGSSGFASVAVDNPSAITVGTRMLVDSEPVIVQDALPPVASTTIAAILYDVGSNGPCSIQTVGGLSIGNMEIPLPEEIRRRYENLNLPAPAPVTVSRTIDFPVNALILIGGAEVVQIQSIALGPDGVLSFRCTTAGTFGPGATIAGIPCFRIDFSSPHSAGSSVTADCQQTIITPPSADPFVAGIQTGITGGPRDWGIINGAPNRASTPKDLVFLCVRFSAMLNVEYVRLQLNLGSNLPVYGKNYFYYEWRANDLFSAIQTVIGNSTALTSQAQGGAVEQGQQDAAFRPGYGQEASRDIGGIAPAPGPNGEVLPTPSADAVFTGRVAQSRQEATDGFVSVGSATSRQLALGDDQWITLMCRLGDFTRVGTDTTLTMSSLTDCAVVAQINNADPATVPTITMEVSEAYLMGGYGPDVGPTLPTYVWRYRYRSTITGERSNPSPSMRAGLRPHRGAVNLIATASPESQCDVIDWFRFGGALARWAYAGSCPNASPVFQDTREDSQIDGGESLRVDLYQPWPSYDLPRMGTCNVAGTSVELASGDAFDIDWAADSAIIINGRATQLYRSPSSTTRLEVIDNVGSGSGVAFSLPAPTLLAQTLPYIWGGPINNTTFVFACGDRADPGRILWSHGNDPDSTSDRNTLVVTSASEPLINGFFYDGVPYVFSSNDLYRVIPTFGQISDFITQKTPCSKGLWSPWAFCVTPTGGCYFLAKDGIYFTQAGSEAVSITDPDLQALFPQDGQPQPTTVRGVPPPNMQSPGRLKLTYVDGYVYFDYQDADGQGTSLVYQEDVKGWMVDRYRSDVTARIGEPGQQVQTNLIGTQSGQLYQLDPLAVNDDGVSFQWALWTPHYGGDDPRVLKQWGDAALNFNSNYATGGVVVTPTINFGMNLLTQNILGAGQGVRRTYIVENNDGVNPPGNGVLSAVYGLRIQGIAADCDIGRPIFYFWEPAGIGKQYAIARRATDYEDLGYKGAKFVQGVVIRANTFNNNKQVQVEYDGNQAGPLLTLQHNGDLEKAYPLDPSGWPPFTAQLVRLRGLGDMQWSLLDWRWVFEPAPETATQWETQETTFDLPGYLAVFDAVIAYAATTDITLTVFHDDHQLNYTLPASGGLYTRPRVIFESDKGKSAKFRLTAAAPFQLYVRDTVVRVQGWGMASGYLMTRPFGGPSREVGAQI